MPLRRSPQLTPALLAANRRNALKSTGPRTVRGRARVAMNSLKHGRYARHLHHRLLRADRWELAQLYRKIRSAICQAFVPLDAAQYRGCESMAAQVWCALRPLLEGSRGKPECPLKSERIPSRVSKVLDTLGPALGPDWVSRVMAALKAPTTAQRRRRVDIRSPRRHIGITFWVQHRRFWTPNRLLTTLMAEDDMPDDWAPERPRGAEWEKTVRVMIYRVGLPTQEERVQAELARLDRRHPRIARWCRRIIAKLDEWGPPALARGH